MSEAIYSNTMGFSEDNAESKFFSDEVEVKQEKISNTPKEEIIELDNDTIFRFSCTIDGESLKLNLFEIGSFAPFIYEKLITLDEMKEQYKMFRSCDTLEDVKGHILKLFKNKKITLGKDKDKEDTIIFHLKVYLISIELNIEIEANRIMTTKKDEALLNLYRIEKDGIKLLNEIDKYCKKLGPNGNNIVEQINAIRQKYKQ